MGSSATLDQTAVVSLEPLPWAALAGAGGSDGDGIGGGLYITTGGVVTLDNKMTVVLNIASTSNNNIYGTVSWMT